MPDPKVVTGITNTTDAVKAGNSEGGTQPFVEKETVAPAPRKLAAGEKGYRAKLGCFTTAMENGTRIAFENGRYYTQDQAEQDMLEQFVKKGLLVEITN